MSDEIEVQQRRLRLKKAVEDLSSMKGMGTELVSVVVPPDRMISDVRHQLSNEAGQAANIKSKLTRKHVSNAISLAPNNNVNPIANRIMSTKPAR